MANEYIKFIDDYNKPTGKASSVHYGDTTRFDKAKEQSEFDPISKIEIIKYVNEFLNGIGVSIIENSTFDPNTINYDSIKNDYNLEDEQDILWIKFTEDGYIGVVAISNDINFDYPTLKEDYNKKNEIGKWCYNTSGIIIHSLEKKWDKSFVLIFPLENIPKEYKREDIERGVGNYLIYKKAPILDFYSHKY
ncbi:MAG: hypothetical protein R3Y35_04580 [Clostridia bacterium]